MSSLDRIQINLEGIGRILRDKKLARQQLPHILHEPVHLGQEIASEGDVP